MGCIPAECTGRKRIRDKLRLAVQEEEIMRKGQLSYDVAVAAAVLFTFAIVFIIANFTYTNVADKMINTSVISSSNATVTVLNAGRVTINRLDYIFFVLFIGMMLSIIIASFLIPANSIFSFIYFISLVVIVAVSSVLSHVFERITANGYFYTIATLNLPITYNLMSNLPMYVTIVGFLAMVLLYAKPQQTY
jgi:hypothetical protein